MFKYVPHLIIYTRFGKAIVAGYILTSAVCIHVFQQAHCGTLSRTFIRQESCREFTSNHLWRTFTFFVQLSIHCLCQNSSFAPALLPQMPSINYRMRELEGWETETKASAIPRHRLITRRSQAWEMKCNTSSTSSLPFQGQLPKQLL